MLRPEVASVSQTERLRAAMAVSSNGRIEITLDERSSVVPAHRSVFGLPVDAWGWPIGASPGRSEASACALDARLTVR